MLVLALSSAAAHAAACPSIEARMGRPASVGAVASVRYPICVRYGDPRDRRVAERLIEVADRTWSKQIGTIGFRFPVLAEDTGRLDVFLTDLAPLDSYTAPLGDTDRYPGDGYMTVAAYVALDRSLPRRLLDARLVHEINHATQYATDFAEDTVVVWDATATAAQRWGYPGRTLWALDVDVFQAHPWLPALAVHPASGTATGARRSRTASHPRRASRRTTWWRSSWR